MTKNTKNTKNNIEKKQNNIDSFWKGFGSIFGSIAEGIAESAAERDKRLYINRRIEASNEYIKESINDLIEKIEENKKLGGAFKNAKIYPNKIVLDISKETDIDTYTDFKSNSEKRLYLINKIEELNIELSNLDFSEMGYMKKKWALEDSIEEYKKELKNLRRV